MNRVTVAVTGAAGQISYAFLFRLASGQVFGPDVMVDLRLIEIDPGMAALEGVVMEINDCAFPQLGSILITSDVVAGMSDVNWAILIGSVPRKKGMERSDLLEINGGIFQVQGAAINEHAADDVRVFVVGNPCNTNCLIAMNHAPDVPRDRFFAMTMLDQNRAVSLMAEKLGVHNTEVENMHIWGNHSATQYPDFYHATVKGTLAVDLLKDEAWGQNEFIPAVQQRGAAVIAARGASSAASAANGVVDSVRHILGLDAAPYSVARCSSGEYGVPEGLICSFPCQTHDGVVEVVEGITHNEFGQAQINASVAELQAECDAVKALSLVS